MASDNGDILADLPTRAPGSSKGWIVQKFGGTSVGKFAVNIVENIVRASAKNNRVAVICSARSSYTKAEGTTNRLLRAAREAEKEEDPQFEAIVNIIAEDHIQAAKADIKSPEILARLVEEIKWECNDLVSFLDATRRVGEVSRRSEDKIISKGEKLSCRYVAALLQDRGVDSQYVDLSDVIDFRIPQGLDQEFYNQLAAALAAKIRACGDKLPVVTGYFGTVPGGLLDKIGRGYTDLCAALVAVGIAADELQVWKEVDGIFTADPRKVLSARLLSAITPAEAAELTFYGSEVIHPFTMEQVILARIPIRIKNVMNPQGKGTIIYPDTPEDFDLAVPPPDAKLSRRRRRSSVLSQPSGPKRPTAVTLKDRIIVLNVHSNKRSLSHGFFAKIFTVLDKWELSVDLISTSEVHVSMALHSESVLPRAGEEIDFKIHDRNLFGAIGELQNYGTVDVIPDMAILSLVGRHMKNLMGIAGRMFVTLGEGNINIDLISQGASEINISCVIKAADGDKALNLLHSHLFNFAD